MGIAPVAEGEEGLAGAQEGDAGAGGQELGRGAGDVASALAILAITTLGTDLGGEEELGGELTLGDVEVVFLHHPIEVGVLDPGVVDHSDADGRFQGQVLGSGRGWLGRRRRGLGGRGGLVLGGLGLGRLDVGSLAIRRLGVASLALGRFAVGRLAFARRAGYHRAGGSQAHSGPVLVRRARGGAAAGGQGRGRWLAKRCRHARFLALIGALSKG